MRRPPAHSFFGRHNHQVHNAAVRRATQYNLHLAAIPAFARELHTGTVVPGSPRHLVDIMHARGINVRHLGTIRALLSTGELAMRSSTYGAARQRQTHLLFTEMLSRTAKLLLRSELRGLADGDTADSGDDDDATTSAGVAAVTTPATKVLTASTPPPPHTHATNGAVIVQKLHEHTAQLAAICGCSDAVADQALMIHSGDLNAAAAWVFSEEGERYQARVTAGTSSDAAPAPAPAQAASSGPTTRAQRLVADCLNRVLSSSAEAAAFWSTRLRTHVRLKFGGRVPALNSHEVQPSVDLRRHVNFTTLLQSLLQQLGVALSVGWLGAWLDSITALHANSSESRQRQAGRTAAVIAEATPPTATVRPNDVEGLQLESRAIQDHTLVTSELKRVCTDLRLRQHRDSLVASYETLGWDPLRSSVGMEISGSTVRYNRLYSTEGCIAAVANRWFVPSEVQVPSLAFSFVLQPGSRYSSLTVGASEYPVTIRGANQAVMHVDEAAFAVGTDGIAYVAGRSRKMFEAATNKFDDDSPVRIDFVFRQMRQAFKVTFSGMSVPLRGQASEVLQLGPYELGPVNNTKPVYPFVACMGRGKSTVTLLAPRGGGLERSQPPPESEAARKPINDTLEAHNRYSALCSEVFGVTSPITSEAFLAFAEHSKAVSVQWSCRHAHFVHGANPC